MEAFCSAEVDYSLPIFLESTFLLPYQLVAYCFFYLFFQKRNVFFYTMDLDNTRELLDYVYTSP